MNHLDNDDLERTKVPKEYAIDFGDDFRQTATWRMLCVKTANGIDDQLSFLTDVLTESNDARLKRLHPHVGYHPSLRTATQDVHPVTVDLVVEFEVPVVVVRVKRGKVTPSELDDLCCAVLAVVSRREPHISVKNSHSS